MNNKHKVIPVDSLLQLRQRLDRLPTKSPERATQVAVVAGLYGISITTVYRALHAFRKPHAPPIELTTASRGYCHKLNWSAIVN